MTARRDVGWSGQWLRQIVLLLATCATLYPVLWVVKMALTPGDAFDLSANPLPAQPTLANFRDVLFAEDAGGHRLFAGWLWNSLVVSLATTAVGLALSCTAAYAFSRFEFPGRELGLRGLLVTQMFPGVVIAIPLYILMDTFHLLDSALGLTLCYATTAIPFCTWTLKGYFDTLPKELEEAAWMDGASRLLIFTRIVLPLSRPALAVTALFSFMTAWNEFILAATFLSSERSYTLPVALQRYVGDYSTEWGAFAAGAILVSVPVMVLFMVLQKQLVAGLTAGGVKG
jgi:arabinogalactan oligomer/maltooligosaccharide transport system permease protein